MKMPSGLSLQQQAQKLYQQGDFNRAVEIFTEALTTSPDSVAILDNRAATYTKLTKYDLALRDARHMIKKDKNDERGYLRCAKVLLLDGKPNKALEVYAYALKTLSKTHPRRQLVEQLHNKLCDKMTAKCCDPFTVLPYEVAVMVLQHFSFKQIVAILRVSKKWDQFLSSMCNIWMRIDLSGARGKVPWTSVRAYIRRSKAMLTGAIVENLSTPSAPKALELLSRCPNLEYLEVRIPYKPKDFYELFKNSKRLKTLITSKDIILPRECVMRLLTDLPLIERIEIHHTRSSPSSNTQWPKQLPNLKRLLLCAQDVQTSELNSLHVPGLSDRSGQYSVSNLEELRLTWFPEMRERYPLELNPSGLPRLRRLYISGMHFNHIELPPSLEYLQICGATSNNSHAFSPTNTHLPRLSTLIFSDVHWLMLEALQLLLGSGEVPLRVLHLGGCFGITGPKLVEFTKNSKLDSLTELNIELQYFVDDKIVDELTSRMSDLEVLNLSSTNVTGVTIKKLADARESNAMKISRVNVRHCEGVSSDAVAYGRARELEVIT